MRTDDYVYVQKTRTFYQSLSFFFFFPDKICLRTKTGSWWLLDEEEQNDNDGEKYGNN
jgi:hypothetical protein